MSSKLHTWYSQGSSSLQNADLAILRLENVLVVSNRIFPRALILPVVCIEMEERIVGYTHTR